LLRKITDPATNEEVWLLRPCDFARVAVTELSKLQTGLEPLLQPRENAGARYGHWTGTLNHRLAVGPAQFVARGYWQNRDRTTGHRSGPYLPHVAVEYSEATVASSGASVVGGVIVFTGKPADGDHVLRRDPRRYYGKKKHEFFFHKSAASEIDVTTFATISFSSTKSGPVFRPRKAGSTGATHSREVKKFPSSTWRRT